jgi:hypothetical protein
LPATPRRCGDRSSLPKPMKINVLILAFGTACRHARGQPETTGEKSRLKIDIKRLISRSDRGFLLLHDGWTQLSVSSNYQRAAHAGRCKAPRRTRWYRRLRRIWERIRRRFGGIWIREWPRNWVGSVSPYNFQIGSRRQLSACITLAANYRTATPFDQTNPIRWLDYRSCASHALCSIA